MKTLDRIILGFLVVGVWALVLKPETPRAQSSQSCEISYATGSGTVDSTDVDVTIKGNKISAELVDDTVTIDSITGEIECW